MNMTTTNILKNITSPTDLIYNINDASTGIFGITVLFVLYIVLFMSVFNYSGDLKTSFNSATYVSLIIAWLMWILNLISTNWLYVFLILGIIGIASLFIRRDM